MRNWPVENVGSIEAPLTTKGSAMKKRIGREIRRAITMTLTHSLTVLQMLGLCGCKDVDEVVKGGLGGVVSLTSLSMMQAL